MIITAGRILHPYLIYITHGLLSSSSFTLLNILYKIFPLTFTSCTFRVVAVSLLAITCSNFHSDGDTLCSFRVYKE